MRQVLSKHRIIDSTMFLLTLVQLVPVFWAAQINIANICFCLSRKAVEYFSIQASQESPVFPKADADTER